MLYMLQLKQKGETPLIDKKFFPYFEKAGTKVNCKAGDIIYMQEDDTENLYLLTEGKVRIFDVADSGREITFKILEQGSILGDSSFFQGSLRPTTAVAVTDARLIACNLEDLYPYFEQSGELAVAFMRMLAARCDNAINLLKRAYSYNRYEKVAAFLLDMADKREEIFYTHEEISTCVGLSRVVVTKVLREFAEEGYIESGYKRITAVDKEGLLQKYPDIR